MAKRPRSRVAAQAHERAEQRLFLRYPDGLFFLLLGLVGSFAFAQRASYICFLLRPYVGAVIVSSDSDPRGHRHWRARSAVYQSSSRSLTTPFVGAAIGYVGLLWQSLCIEDPVFAQAFLVRGCLRRSTCMLLVFLRDLVTTTLFIVFGSSACLMVSASWFLAVFPCVFDEGLSSSNCVDRRHHKPHVFSLPMSSSRPGLLCDFVTVALFFVARFFAARVSLGDEVLLVRGFVCTGTGNFYASC